MMESEWMQSWGGGEVLSSGFSDFSPQPSNSARVLLWLMANLCGLTSVYHLYIMMDIHKRLTMKTAKVFKSGNSQAVRIPKEFHLEGSEVEIQKKGDVLILRPKKKSWATFFQSLGKFSDDFMLTGRKQLPVQQRKRLFP